MISTTGSRFQGLGAISTPSCTTYTPPRYHVSSARHKPTPPLLPSIPYHPIRTLSCLGYITLQRYRFFFFRTAATHRPTSTATTTYLTFAQSLALPTSSAPIRERFLHEIDLTLTGATDPPTLHYSCCNLTTFPLIISSPRLYSALLCSTELSAL